MNYLVILSFINFSVYLLLSNYFDWEQFYAFIEADRRAWVNDADLPLWSYQLCGGLTRIGDPQSFGLSPIFIFPLIFGTVLGAKIMVIFVTLIGYIFTKKTFLLFSEKEQQRSSFFNLLPLFYIFSGGFIAHFHVGHLTYINFHLFSIINYIVFKIILSKALTRKDYLYSFLAIFTIFMGGFYHSLAFWGLPLAISCLIFLIYNATFDFQSASKKFELFFKALIIPFLLSSYKFIHVFLYQINNPRSLGDLSTAEFNSLWDLIKFHFIPVKDFQSYWFGFAHDHKYGMFENTAFSFFPVLLLLAITLVFKQKVKIDFPNKNLLSFLIILFLTFFFLSLGNFSDLSPFNLLNQYLLSDSLRVSVRYNLGVCFVFFCILAILFSRVVIKKLANLFIIFLLVLVNIYFYIPFFTYGFNTYQTVQGLEFNPKPEMNEVAFVPNGTAFNSNNYSYIKKGYATLNCYNPITRRVVASQSLSHKDQGKESIYSVVDIQSSSVSQKCEESIYLMQNQITIPKECQGRLCLNVNDISPSDWKKGFEFNSQFKKYCINL